MRIKNLLLFKFIILLTIKYFCVHAQSYQWTKTFGGGSTDYSKSITIAAPSGNIYVTGTFVSSVDFDPGVGTDSYTSNGSSDIFVQKLNANGDQVWTKTFGGTNLDNVTSIATDINENIYVTGYFNGTIDFDPGLDTDIRTTGGYDALYVQALDVSGNYKWTNTIVVSTTLSHGHSIATDDSGYIYVTGYFQGTVDFDPGIGIDNHTSAAQDVFIQKLDTAGNFVWATTFGGTGGDIAQANCININVNGSIYLIGIFDGTVDFNPGINIDNHTSFDRDIFILKLNEDGAYIWAKTFGSTSHDFGNFISTDISGNVYSTGYFQGTVDFNPGSGIDNHTSSSYDVFVQKLDSNGNFLWANTFPGRGNGICTDVNNNVYVTGYFSGTVDFDPSSGTNIQTAYNGDDVFVENMDSSGNFVWAKTFGGLMSDHGNAITADDLGNIYLTGEFYSAVDFDPSSGTDNHTANGMYDVYVWKYAANSIVSSITENANHNFVSIYPNPTDGKLVIDLVYEQKQIIVTIQDIIGNIILIAEYDQSKMLDVSIVNLPAGIYFLNIRTGKEQEAVKIIRK
jgi:cytoskeletal protein CcmA (bactofilin family)